MMKKWVVVLLLLFIAGPLFAQWQAGPPLIKPVFGGMCFRDGLLWVGSSNRLLMSADTGVTWTTIADQQEFEYIFDIDFFDRDNGLVVTAGLTYRTTDRGVTWHAIGPGDFTACYGSDVNTIAVVSNPSSLMITTDGGTNWKRVTFPAGVMKVARWESGFECFVGNPLQRPYPAGHLYRSTDKGSTWQASTGNVDFDSYSFAIDSCDRDRIYVVNEDAIAPTDNFAQIFLTTDGGTTYQTPLVQRLNGVGGSLSGSIAITRNTLYSTTTGSNGIMRSTDLGLSWKSIGGPSTNVDSRLIAAVDDNIVFAVDKDGTVWRTMNSGGDSVRPAENFHSIAISPHILNLGDSSSPCRSASGTITIGRTCRAPMLSTAVLHGPDSANFVIRQFGDSVTVEFIPTSSVDAHDTLTLNFDEGSRQQILLTGIGGVSQPITLSSTSVTEDTIGATVYVPIKISTSAPIAGTTIQLHYDTTMLVYRGAFEAGTPNDRTIQTSITSATIHFDGPARTKDTIIGYAAFSVYPSLTPCTTVTFDSVQFNRMPGVCIQSNSEFSADVCMPLSCGATDIGRFERYRVLPELSVTPNPAANVLWLMSSIDLGPTQIELFDIMGRHLGAYASTVSAHTAQPMNLSGIANGIYTLRVSTGSITRSVRVVVQK